MKKILVALLVVLLFGFVVLMFSIHKMALPNTNIPTSTLLKKIVAKKEKHIVKADFEGLKTKQTLPALQKLVSELGFESYTIGDKVLTLQNGQYQGEIGGKSITVSLIDVFFSPTDKNGAQGAVIVLASEEAGGDGAAYYMVTRLPNGTFTDATLMNHNVYVSGVAIKGGLITVLYRDTVQGSDKEMIFALTKQKKSSVPIIEALPANTLVTK